MSGSKTAPDVKSTANVVATTLDAALKLAQVTLLVSAERDRFRDALQVIAHAPYGEISHWAMQRIAREALESRS